MSPSVARKVLEIFAQQAQGWGLGKQVKHLHLPLLVNHYCRTTSPTVGTAGFPFGSGSPTPPDAVRSLIQSGCRQFCLHLPSPEKIFVVRSMVTKSSAR